MSCDLNADDVSHTGGFGNYMFQLSKKYSNKIRYINEATGEKVTYAEHTQTTVRIALRLKEAGVEPQDLIAVCAGNSIDVTNIPEVAFYLGAILGPISPDYLTNYKESFILFSKPKFIFTDKENAEFFQNLKQTHNLEVKIYVFGTEEFEKLKEPHDDEDTFKPIFLQDLDTTIAIVICTSGTTDNFKAVNMMHASSLKYMHQYLESEKYLDVALMNFIFVSGSGMLLNGLVSSTGGTIVMLTNWSMENSLKAVHNFKVTHLRIIPLMLIGMTRSPLIAKYSVESVKYICVFGATIYRSQIQECQKKFKNAYIMNTYGCLEAPTIFKFDVEAGKDFILAKADSVGRLWRKDIEVKVVDLDSGEEVGSNETGEVIVRGKNLFNGYYKNPEASAKVLDKDGWLRTGDLGYFDKDQCMFILGRKEIVLRHKGVKTSPAEIERVVVEHTAVQESAVVPFRQENEDKAVVVIIKRPNYGNTTEKDILDFAHARLPEEKQLIKSVQFVQDFPRTPIGKIRIEELRKRITGQS